MGIFKKNAPGNRIFAKRVKTYGVINLQVILENAIKMHALYKGNRISYFAYDT